VVVFANMDSNYTMASDKDKRVDVMQPATGTSADNTDEVCGFRTLPAVIISGNNADGLHTRHVDRAHHRGR